MKEPKLDPWPDLAMARSFLGFLSGTYPTFEPQSTAIDNQQIARWLIEHGIASLAYDKYRADYPELAQHLQEDTFSTVAENGLHWQILEEISAAFSKEDIPIVLLKGAALAHTVYGGRDLRTMSDVDIWLRTYDVQRACALMDDLGFVNKEKKSRPLALQMMLDGELQFWRTGWQQGLVEFHLSPFSGWWLKRTSAVDNNALWSRIEPLPVLPDAFQLSAEDTVIHVAVHMAVNHQCGFWAVRSLLDLALTANKRVVDWDIVAARAENWRVGNAVWLALHLLHQLFGVRGFEKSLHRLQPPAWKRRYLQNLVNPKSVILGSDLRSGRKRYLLLLLLVDRNRDTGHLVYRTLWPEKSWLHARYGESVGHWQHLNRIIRFDQS